LRVLIEKLTQKLKAIALDKDKFYKSFKERAAESKNANLLEQGKKDLEARKAAEAEFYKELERKQKTLEARQEAERFQATAKTYRPLTTGNMFDQLNTEDKKAAQAKANATGVSQEYSVFGQAKAAFSRQAARFDNESLQKKQVQEKLALEVSQLADLQQQQRNQNIAEYNKNLEKEAKLLAEVNQLKKTFEDSTQEVDKKAFDNKKAELDLIQDTNKAYREAEEKLNEAIEARSNTINNLKDNLQALIDKYDLLDTTMSAGVQSMTSGLSSIFSDWASGVIQNTEDVKEAFRSLGQSVLQSMAKVVSDRIAQQFMGFLLNGLGSMFGSSLVPPR
jgi:DNA repair exonuclease SbcCD ATPase subunit